MALADRGKEQVMAKKAVVLLSGGLDSATVLAIAKDAGFVPYALSFRYGQRHETELSAAERIARELGAADHKIAEVSLSMFGGSALTDSSIDVPKGRSSSEMSGGIPTTYVPARNTVFLSIALAWAEVLHADDIYLGVNEVDYSGYPDCRPEYIEAFQRMANLATKEAVQGRQHIAIHAPLIQLSKAEIIQRGVTLGLDYALTHSCYHPDQEGLACGYCASCNIRREGFRDAGVADPTRYQDSYRAVA
jgi:7-cyano-7-deazaguanine synthase